MKGLHGLAVLLMCLLMGLLPQIAPAQNSNSGAILGIVQDPTGSVIPGVSVDILNVNTGIHQTRQTNHDGLYTVTSVPLGEYAITFSMTGFQTFIRNGIVVYIGTTTVNADLKVGAQTEEITVSGQAPLLETESSDQTTTLDTHAVESMPVVGTDWRSLNGVLPGVNAAGGQSANGQFVGYNGTQGDFLTWLFDGSPAVNAQDDAPSQLYPPTDAIQEVTSSTANYSAQYGNGMQVINVITKSGTNQIHGSMFEMFQNDIFKARNYFSPRVNELRWNDFGGSLGGPIIKNKLFLFVSYMENPAVTTAPTFYTFPTVAMRRGDFSDPQFPTIYDPSSLTYVNGVATRTPLLGNKITTIDPVAAKIEAFWPLPNNLGPNGNSLFNNYYQGVKKFETNRWYEGKIDYVINERNRLSGSAMVQPQNRPSGGDPRCPLDCYTGVFRDQAAQLTYTSTVTPRLINEARIGYSAESVTEVSFSAGKGFPNQIGLINPPADIFPVINVTGLVSSELDGGTVAIQSPDTELFSDFVTLVRGKHVVKIGGEFDRYHIDLTAFGNTSSGSFAFNGIATRNPADPKSTGLGYADFLFGLPQSWSVTESPLHEVHEYAGGLFVQDDVKVSQKLTLNMGIRWAPSGGWGVTDNKFGVFSPTVINPATSTPGALEFGGMNGRNTMPNATFTPIAPRIGLAWTPRDHWVVRASYGIFRAFRTEASYITGMVGVGDNTQGAKTSPDNINPVFTLGPNESYGQAYVQGPPMPVSPTAATKTPDLLNGQSVIYEAKNIPSLYVQQVYIDLQHELKGGILVDAGYVNTAGVHLLFARDINQVPEALLGPGTAQAKRPYPQFNGITNILWDGTSNYNALQLRAEKHAARGLLFIANYAWSKTQDTGTANGSAQNVDTYQRSYDRHANYALSTLHDSYMVNGLVSYDLPFGKGRLFISRSGILDAVVGGWRISASSQIHGGIPFTPKMGTANLSNSLAGSWFPNRVGSGRLANPTISKWFDTSAFQQPAQYTFGNSRRNILLGPSWRSADASLGKTFSLDRLREGAGFEFRVDAFDVLNHPNFGQPNASIGTSGAGIISSANTSRNFEFTGRIRF